MFILPDLPYASGALAPVISEATLLTHHGKHHARYVESTNALLANGDASPATLEDVVRRAARGDTSLFNNAAQAWNHAFFWRCMRPGGAPVPDALAAAVALAFGDQAGLRSEFLAKGAAHFGSGWLWLVARGAVLSVISTHDAGSPLVDPGLTPLLVCDLWEHAYYLDHRNDRTGFLIAWWDQLVDWSFVGAQLDAAIADEAGWRYPEAVA
jgi:Fe-Mn family superoxide dismutase